MVGYKTRSPKNSERQMKECDVLACMTWSICEMKDDDARIEISRQA